MKPTPLILQNAALGIPSTKVQDKFHVNTTPIFLSKKIEVESPSLSFFKKGKRPNERPHTN